jgi:2-hydroxycyclohexanecarboxyl-CoA dehydrogenase
LKVNLELDDSIVLVVGGASGIGLACVDRFLAENATVVIFDQSPACEQIATQRKNCHAHVIDITQEATVRAAVTRAEQQIGPIRHVVHAAAVGSGKSGAPFTNLQPSDWRRVIEVNVLGVVNVAHAVTPAMMERSEGTMVFVASVAGQIGSPTDPPYSASKAANINFVQVMAKDLARHGIRVNTVCPGMVKTPLNQTVWQSWNDRQSVADKLTYEQWAAAKIKQLVPLGRWQKAEDIADMIVFLSSARASEVTGQTINVDGGYVMHS